MPVRRARASVRSAHPPKSRSTELKRPCADSRSCVRRSFASRTTRAAWQMWPKIRFLSSCETSWYEKARIDTWTMGQELRDVRRGVEECRIFLSFLARHCARERRHHHPPPPHAGRPLGPPFLGDFV